MSDPVPHTGFTEAQVDALTRRGISVALAQSYGVRSVISRDELPPASPDYWTTDNGYLPGLLFPWRSPDGETVEYQLRPDVPVEYDGDVRKYVFRKDAPSILTVGHVGTDDGPVLVVEGTCQTLAASAYAPDDLTVYGIAGAQSWMKKGVPTRDLAVVDGRDVFIALDADAASNLDVYTAGVQLREACIAQGAQVVRFVRIPGGRKSGLDDVLAAETEARRTRYVQRLVELAQSRPRSEKPELPSVAKPKPKSKKDADSPDASPFFDGEKLKVATLAQTIAANQPAALTREDKVALFAGGVFRIDGTAFIAAVTHLLGEDFRTSHRSNVQEFMVGRLAAANERLDDRMNEPLMNVLNGMVDLRTGELLEHDAKYMSSVQFPIEWDADATCPTYETWTKEQIGDQLDDLEETVAVMLDPSQSPTKAAFLFGPSRSGKSTFLRLLQDIAGAENTSAVSLHALSDDRFAAANVYGKALNVSADLKAAHVDDVSMFKLMTGEDLITANRKFGAQFAFTNRALFAFSANELPTVGESSRAYSERIKPFLFPNSFAGREDNTLEVRLRAELPGILVRWVRAWQRRNERGVPLPTNSAVRDAFEQASDRVRAFVAECCDIVPVQVGKGGTTGGTEATTTELYNAFKSWVEEEGRTAMAKGKVRDRLRTIPGVTETVSGGKSRGWNLKVRPRGEWGQTGRESNGTEADTNGAEGGNSAPSDLLATDAGCTVLAEDDLGENMKLSEVMQVMRKVQSSEAAAERARQGSVSPIDAMIDENADPAMVPADLCPDCDRERELVPHAYFWRACRHCHPQTFTRV